ncbi:MAG: YhbY family RNA-binding protein, partial [Gammaproteobacteria bacterium]|nr:YhbY family RNA-binding protein [Gammaproteobacteria bacterium]
INIALEAHELIKVKLAGADREVRNAWAQTIEKSLSAIIVQQIGQICVFYRKNEDKK